MNIKIPIKEFNYEEQFFTLDYYIFDYYRLPEKLCQSFYYKFWIINSELYSNDILIKDFYAQNTFDSNNKKELRKFLDSNKIYIYHKQLTKNKLKSLDYILIDEKYIEKGKKLKEWYDEFIIANSASKNDFYGNLINIDDLVILRTKNSTLGKIKSIFDPYWIVSTKNGDVKVRGESIIVLPKCEDEFKDLNTKFILDILRN